MNSALIGAMAGGVLGLVQYIVLSRLAGQVALDKPEAEARQRADMLRSIARFDVVVLLVIGYFAGPLVLE